MRAYGALETYLPTLSKTGSYPEAPTINLPDGTRLHRALFRDCGVSLFGSSLRLRAHVDETSRFRFRYREGNDPYPRRSN